MELSAMCPFKDEYVLFWTSCILYGIAAGLAFASLRSERQPFRVLFLTVLGGGFVLQTASLHLRGGEVGRFPVTNPFEILQTVSWAFVGTNLVIRQIFSIKPLNAFSAMAAAVLALFSLAVPAWDTPAPEAWGEESPWGRFHVLLAILSYALFGVLCMTSLMHLMQHYSLRNRQSNLLLMMLPSIRQIEAFNPHLLAVAFSIFTLSLGIGLMDFAVYASHVGLGKLIFAVLLWLAYGGVLLVQKRHAMRIHHFSALCALLFVVAVAGVGLLTAR